MKKLAIVCLINMYFLPCVASPLETYDDSSNTLQEWCAKEEDPVKRLHYCRLLETQNHASLIKQNKNIEILTG